MSPYFWSSQSSLFCLEHSRSFQACLKNSVFWTVTVIFFLILFFNLAFHTSKVVKSLPKESSSWIGLILKIPQCFQSALHVKLWLSNTQSHRRVCSKIPTIEGKDFLTFLVFWKMWWLPSKIFLFRSVRLHQ